MTKIEQILAEIEKIKADCPLVTQHTTAYAAGIVSGKKEVCGALLKLINSLPNSLPEEPISEELEEASEKFANTQDKNFLNPEIVKHIFKTGAGWMSKQFEKKEPISDDLEKAAFDYAEACKYDGGEELLCAEHFKAGAKWQKKQITNKVISWID